MTTSRRYRAPLSRLAPVLLAARAGLAPVPAAAQTDTAPLRTVEFETDEGTRMHVDVSPDGRTLVFELLGDLYTLPIGGGTATPLLTGRAWDRSPQWSPDGKTVAFLSDRVGVSNVWLLDVASRRLRQLTTYDQPGTFGVMGTPMWVPGGREIVYGGISHRRQLSMVATDGGAPRPFVPELTAPDSVPGGLFVYTATFTPDGRTAFFEVSTQLATWVKPRVQNYRTVLYRLDRITRELTEVTAPVAGRQEFTPRVSRSGRWLAYGRKDGTGAAELRVRDLRSGVDRRLTTLTDADDPFSTGHWEDEAIPAYAFTPDDRFIVLWYGGKLHRVTVADGTSRPIPFTVRVRQEVAVPVRGNTRLPDGPLAVRALRWPSLSADGRTLVFSALGHLWSAAVPQGQPRRLTESDVIETMPAPSPDGKRVAYVAFGRTADTERGPGVLMLLDRSTGRAEPVLIDTASYYIPSWSPDGTKLAVVREAGTGRSATAEFGWVDLAARTFHAVAKATPFSRPDWRGVSAQRVLFTDDGRHLIITHGNPDLLTTYRAASEPPSLVLQTVALDGSGVRTLVTTHADVKGVVPAPDLSRVVLLGWDDEAYLMALSAGGSSTRVSIRDHAARRISDGGALYPAWRDRSTLTYGWLDAISAYDVGEARTTLVRRVALEVPRRVGRGMIAFRNARLITVAGARGADPVIERGTLLVRDGRIAAVGPVDRVAVPAEARVIDATGWTIMPGLVESHMHGLLGTGSGSTLGHPLVPPPDLSIGIAYGVTTVWDAAESNDDRALARIELIESGRLRGPRWLHAGGGLIGWIDNGGVSNTVEGMRASVRGQVARGAACLKNNHWYVRASQQWWAEEARRAGVCVVGHANSMVQLLSMAADGIAVDHFSLPTPSYRDVVQWLVRTGTIWTPHALGAGSTTGGPQAAARRSFIEELRTRGDSEQIEKLERFGRSHLDWYENYPVMPYARTAAARVDRLAARVVAAGGKVAASADTPNNAGQIEIHAAMWGLQRGGMTPGDALRAGTMSAAEKLGVQADVGSLAPGKLADFLVLTANPLERIENTLALEYTVIAGVIYDSGTTEVLDATELAATRQ